jgi:hypothetical protein
MSATAERETCAAGERTVTDFMKVELGAPRVRFARSVGLVRGEWAVIDGSKFQAVTSARSVAERESIKRYLDAVEAGDQQEEPVIDASAVEAALDSLVPLLPRSLLFRSGPFCPLFTDHRRQVTTHHPLTTNH